jgi:hypothetical protein
VSLAKRSAKWIKRDECASLNWRSAERLARERRDAADPGTAGTGAAAAKPSGGGTTAAGTAGTGLAAAKPSTGTTTTTKPSIHSTTAGKRTRGPGRPPTGAKTPNTRSTGTKTPQTPEELAEPEELPGNPIYWLEEDARSPFKGSKYDKDILLEIGKNIIGEALLRDDGTTFGDWDFFEVSKDPTRILANGTVSKFREQWRYDDFAPVMDNHFKILLRYKSKLPAWWICERASEIVEGAADLLKTTATWSTQPETKKLVDKAVKSVLEFAQKLEQASQSS